MPVEQRPFQNSPEQTNAEQARRAFLRRVAGTAVTAPAAALLLAASAKHAQATPINCVLYPDRCG